MVNCILTAMLAKTTEGIGIGTSRMSCLHTGLANRNPPFFLLYGHDPRLPTPAALSPAKVETNLDFKAYGADLVTWMSTAWKTASVKKVQKWQKKYYDKKSRVPNFEFGDHVFLYQPEEHTGKTLDGHDNK